MAIAGRVAIVPKDAYDSTVAYQKLDLVRYNHNVYIAKKSSTGILPTDEEYWMLAIENVTQEQYEAIVNGTTAVGNALQLGGKSASEYLTKDGGEIDGNLSLVSAGETYRIFKLKNANREIHIRITNTGIFQILDNTNTKMLFDSSTDGVTNTFYGIATGNLPLYGGKLTDASSVILRLDKTGDSALNLLDFLLNGTRLGCLGFWEKDKPIFYTSDNQVRYLLHNGNVGDYALPKTGGVLGDGTAEIVLGLNGNKNQSLMGLYKLNTLCGMLGIGSRNAPVYIPADWSAEYTLLHSGNVGSYTAGNAEYLNAQHGNEINFKGLTGINGMYFNYRNGSTDAFDDAPLYWYAFGDKSTPDGGNTIFLNLNEGSGQRNILHTGNSQKVTITADAPSDTTALWVDTANKKVKAYIDGAWTVMTM